MLKTTLINAFLLIAISLFATGCANRATATPYPKAEVNKLKTVYVKKLPADIHGINNLIVEKFRTMGYEASTGSTMPSETDVVVTYIDKWQWDMTMYMIELTIVVREPGTNFPIAQGNSYHTSLTRESPKEMVDEVIDNIFKYEEVKQ